MTSKSLRHWLSVHELTLSQACFLIAGVDPNNLGANPNAAQAEAKTYELAFRQGVEQAHLFAHRYVHGGGLVENPNVPDIWAFADDVRCLPTNELRNSVCEVQKDPVHVPLLLLIDDWFSATVYGGDLRDWLERSNIESEFKFGDHQKVVICPEGTSFWPEKIDSNPSRSNGPETTSAGPWPWGSFETRLLKDLSAAAKKWWSNFDPSDNTTAPKNEDVSKWLVHERGVSTRMAEAMATILRADDLPTGPRT
jgi:hypothetical protein